jgi:cytosine/uracil/thiamine/allantoin permease
LITSAAVVVFPHMKHEDLWDPVKLVGQFSQAWVVAISMFTIVVATLSVNIAANVVSPANDFANAFPKWISFRTGGLITGIIGILMMPWKLLADPSGYIFSWLLCYSGGLGSIAGVLIADYWLIRKKNLKLADLYREKGVFSFEEKINPLDKLSVILFFGIFGYFLHSLLDVKLQLGRITGSAVNIIVLVVMVVIFAFLGYVLAKKGANWRACLATLMGCFFAWIGLIFDLLGFDESISATGKFSRG